MLSGSGWVGRWRLETAHPVAVLQSSSSGSSGSQRLISMSGELSVVRLPDRTVWEPLMSRVGTNYRRVRSPGVVLVSALGPP